MARPLRIQFKGAWYHVMNRGAGRRAVFLTDEHRIYFLELLDEIAQVYGIEVHAYCLMGNHYHLIIHTPRGNLSEAMRHLNSRYTQYFNRSTHKDGALFRGRYKAIVVSAELYLLRLSRYVHLNPLKAKLVDDLKNYRWSSFRAYLGRKSDLPCLHTSEILKRFELREFKGSYKKFVETTHDSELDEFYSDTKFLPVLGDENYCEAIFDFIKTQSLSAEIVGAENIVAAPSLDVITSTVAKYYGVSVSDITHCQKRVKNPARQVAILLARELGGESLNEIAGFMGGVGYAVVSKTVARVKQDDELMRDVQIVRKRILRNAKSLA